MADAPRYGIEVSKRVVPLRQTHRRRLGSTVLLAQRRGRGARAPAFRLHCCFL